MTAPRLDNAPCASFLWFTGLGPRFALLMFRSGFTPRSLTQCSVQWYPTTLDIDEILSNTRQGDFHIFVADVVKTFDTVDRDVLDCALERLGLPAWFSQGFLLCPQRSSSSIETCQWARSSLD